MRDEDLKNLPQSIEAWKIKEMLEALGITDWSNVRRTVILPRSICIDVLATDENGSRYWVTAEDGSQEVAEHKISIPIVGPWKKPDAAVAEDPRAPRGCPARESGRMLICERPAGHAGHHMQGGTVWADLLGAAVDPKDLSLEDREQMQADIAGDLGDCETYETRRTGASVDRWMCALPLGHAGEHSYRVCVGPVEETGPVVKRPPHPPRDARDRPTG